MRILTSEINLKEGQYILIDSSLVHKLTERVESLEQKIEKLLSSKSAIPRIHEYSISTIDICRDFLIKPKTVSKWIREGKLPHPRKVGRKNFFKIEDIRKVIESQQPFMRRRRNKLKVLM